MSTNRVVSGKPTETIDDYDPGRMHVVRDGPRQEAPLLLIHGTAGSVAWWDPVVPALAQRHHVIRVDLPGHGQSPPPPSYDVAAQATRVAAGLDSLGVGPVIVIGHSSGGCVATALAEQRPDLIRAVALINTGPRPDALWPQPAVIRALSTPPLSRIAWSLRSLVVRRALHTAFTRPVDIPDDLVAAVEGMTYRAFVTAPQELTTYLAERALPDRLAGLDRPLLVIFGAEDHRWDSSSAHSYEIAPKARVEMLPGIGHTPMFEAPEVVSRLLLDFAASSGRPSEHGAIRS
jgi:pimeloyl-ACP methyl ester carboxylesterase